MKIRNARAIPAVLAAVAGMTAGALAQDTAPKSEPATTAVLQQPAAPANPAEAKKVLDRARGAYKVLKSYQDTAKLKWEMRAKDGNGADQNEDEVEDVLFVFAGERRFTLTHKDFAVYSDGKTQVAHDRTEHQYVERSAEDGVMEEATNEQFGVLAAVHAPASLMISPAEFEQAFPLMSQPMGVSSAQLNGKSGKRVWGRGELPGTAPGELVPITMWFSDETGLIGEITIDLKPTYDAKPEHGLKIEKATATVTFADIKVNTEVPADGFTFKPGEDDKKIRSFDPQQMLVGEPSPDFKGVDLDGKPIALADFKGKVVVLDFWATWCGYCMQSMPKFQELATEYASKDVVIVGMNEDAAEATEVVKQAVEHYKLTFRQFMDSGKTVSEQFKVDEIPCVVLIDKNGVVQWIRVGTSPGLKKEIAERLDKLLSGQSLVNADQK